MGEHTGTLTSLKCDPQNLYLNVKGDPPYLDVKGDPPYLNVKGDPLYWGSGMRAKENDCHLLQSLALDEGLCERGRVLVRERGEGKESAHGAQ